MTKQIDDLSMQLADAIYADQHPETPVDPVTGAKGPKYNAYDLGEWIYEIQVKHDAVGSVTIDMFTQWPRLHHWIRERLDEHVELNLSYALVSKGSDMLLVKAIQPGSKIQRTAFLTRQVMLEMLQERGVPESMYSAYGPIETLWSKVLAYECL
jgi:hypothetical protein